MSKSNLPFGSEFSPSQIDLPTVLMFCKQYSGNKELLEKKILETYFSHHGHNNLANQKKLAMNCRLGLKAYGIINENSEITTFGKELYNNRKDEKKLYDILAKHILLNLNGMVFIQCLRDMAVAAEPITLATLRPALKEHGIYYPSGGKHPSIMRLWLSKAGVIMENSWQVNNDHINEILGINCEIESLRNLNTLQRTFLLTMANIDIKEEQPANEVAKLAETTYGVKFPEKSLPKDVLNPLVAAGFINIKKTTNGRGAKPFSVMPTDKLESKIIIPLIKQIEVQTDSKLIALLRKPLSDILDEIKSKNKYISGLALEALAFKLMRILGMDFLATRLRAEATGGAEVDLIFETARLVYSRWQIQCKNTAHVSLEDVAKEVGLTHYLNSNVIVIVTTGKISKPAREYSNKIMQTSNLSIVLLDGYDIKKVAKDTIAIISSFQREAKNAMQLKKLNI